MPTVELRGNTELRMALKRFAPDLEKNLRKEMTAGLKPVVTRARGYVTAEPPMSHWFGGKSAKKITQYTSQFRKGKFPLYNPTIIKRGIVFSTSVSKHNKNGFTSNAAIYNKSAVGAIYETAGRKNPQGQKWVGPKAGGTGKGVSRSANPNAGATFIANLPKLVESKQGFGRLIYRAWAEDLGRAHKIVNVALDKTKKEFYARSQTTSFKKVA